MSHCDALSVGWLVLVITRLNPLRVGGSFFNNAEATRDLVTRVLLNAKTMNSISESLVLQPYVTVASHATNQGIQLLHWGQSMVSGKRL